MWEWDSIEIWLAASYLDLSPIRYRRYDKEAPWSSSAPTSHPSILPCNPRQVHNIARSTLSAFTLWRRLTSSQVSAMVSCFLRDVSPRVLTARQGSRVGQACRSCHVRKIKCDLPSLGIPPCTRCLQSDLPCHRFTKRRRVNRVLQAALNQPKDG